MVQRVRNALLRTRFAAPGIGLTSVPVNKSTVEYNLEYRPPTNQEDRAMWLDAVLKIKIGTPTGSEALYQWMDQARPVKLGDGRNMMACYMSQDTQEGGYNFWFTVSHAIVDGRGLLHLGDLFLEKLSLEPLDENWGEEVVRLESPFVEFARPVQSCAAGRVREDLGKMLAAQATANAMIAPDAKLPVKSDITYLPGGSRVVGFRLDKDQTSSLIRLAKSRNTSITYIVGVVALLATLKHASNRQEARSTGFALLFADQRWRASDAKLYYGATCSGSSIEKEVTQAMQRLLDAGESSSVEDHPVVDWNDFWDLCEELKSAWTALRDNDFLFAAADALADTLANIAYHQPEKVFTPKLVFSPVGRIDDYMTATRVTEGGATIDLREPKIRNQGPCTSPISHFWSYDGCLVWDLTYGEMYYDPPVIDSFNDFMRDYLLSLIGHQ